jgi:hypothetical protein
MAQRQRHRFAATRQGRAAPVRGAIALLAFLALLPGAAAPAHHQQAKSQRTFATPEEAVRALIVAVKSKSKDALFAVIGEEMRGTLTTGNPLLDAVNLRHFLQAASIKRIEPDKDDPNRRIVYFGQQEWPFPAPLVKEGSAWRFDGAAGRQEVADRRIGRNELNAIDACHGYVAAQLEYASRDHNDDGYLEFAQRLFSAPGKKDGLYWSNDEDQDLSPIGPFFADAAAAIARGEKPEPYAGYYFRILQAQGEHATGGARSYLVDGHMIGGFALVAWPAEYGKSGVKSFLVNQLGVVYEKDLGPDSEAIAKGMAAYDPDDTWQQIKE